MLRDKRLAALLASPSASLREISASRLAAFMPNIETDPSPPKFSMTKRGQR
jgi:hypothetical protein